MLGGGVGACYPQFLKQLSKVVSKTTFFCSIPSTLLKSKAFALHNIQPCCGPVYELDFLKMIYFAKM